MEELEEIEGHKWLKFRFHVNTNLVGSEISETVPVAIPEDAAEHEIDDIVQREFEVWLSNEIDAGWRAVEEGERT